MQSSYAVMIGIHLAERLFEAPAKYPDLYTVLNVLWSTALFFGFLVYWHICQFNTLSKLGKASAKKKKS